MKTMRRFIACAFTLAAVLATPAIAQDSGPGSASHGFGELKGMPPQEDTAVPSKDQMAPLTKGPVQVDPFYKVTKVAKQLDPGNPVDLPLTRSFEGITDTGWFPPDPIIAAGPDHLVACTNAHIAYFTKEGKKISQTSAVSFFGSLATGYRLFDPWVIYDKFSNRFMILFTSTKGNPKTASRYYLAISKTSNPKQGWWLYYNNATLNGGSSTSNWADYPRLATDENAIYITANMFGFSSGFQYCKIRIMQNKSTMLSGGASQLWWDFWNITISGSSTKAFSIQPCHDYDDKSVSTPAFFISSINGTGSNLYLYAINNVTRRTAPTPAMFKTKVAVGSYQSPGNSVQKGGSQVIENVAPRLMNAVKRNGSIWTAHSVKVSSSGGAGALWYELRVNSWPTSGSVTKRQEQNFHGGTSYYYTFPSVAVNQNNDMSMVFCRSGSTEYCGVRMSGRLGTKALNLLDGSVQVKAGEAYYVRLGSGRNRWGDYLGNCVDPQGDFWFIGEYAKPSNKWSTRIGTTQQHSSFAYVPDSSATTGTCNVIPFGDSGSATWKNQKYQQLITAAELGNACVADICDLGFASCGTGTRHFDSIVIRLAQTNQTSLVTTFNSNLDANLRTVLSQSNYDWHQVANQWSQIGLEYSYRYDRSRGRNLVIQIEVRGARISTSTHGHHRGTRQRVFAYNYTGSPPTTGTSGLAALKVQLLLGSYDVHQYGLSCKGSNGKSPVCAISGSGRIGTSYNLNLSGALPNASTFISLGIGLWNPPLDLKIIGAPGCGMYFSNFVTLTGKCNSAGSYSLPLSVPTATEPCLRVYFQFFPFDRAANNLGLTTTNYVKLLTGH